MPDSSKVSGKYTCKKKFVRGFDVKSGFDTKSYLGFFEGS